MNTHEPDAPDAATTTDRELGTVRGPGQWAGNFLLMKISLGVILAGFAFVAAGAEFKGDIEYARAGDTALHLDACVPDGNGPFPIAILIHGGGWGAGDKRGDVTPLMEPLTQAGFIWFSIDYRLAPTNQWPACFEDVQASIRWVKAHASEFKGDSNRIALIRSEERRVGKECA